MKLQSDGSYKIEEEKYINNNGRKKKKKRNYIIDKFGKIL